MSINPTATDDIEVQCVRCRNCHMKSERKSVNVGNGVCHLTCPRCSCKSYYDLRPQVAWCWSSGLVEVGDKDAVPEGGIVIAHGTKSYLHGVLSVVCRQGRGASEGKLLVPGIPEASGQQAAGDALAKWLAWCAKGNGHKGRHGIVFNTERATL